MRITDKKLRLAIATSQWWSTLGLALFAGGLALFTVGIAIYSLPMNNTGEAYIRILLFGASLSSLGAITLAYSKLILDRNY